MAEPTPLDSAQTARLTAELAGLVTELSVELDPADRGRLAAVAERCDVILALLDSLRTPASGAASA